MGYYMRFFVTDQQSLTLDLLESALKDIDPYYAIVDRHPSKAANGILIHGEEPYGEIEINMPGDQLFADEITEFREFLGDTDGPNKQIVLDALSQARAIVAVRVLWQDRDDEDTLRRIDLLWSWLFDHHKGLMQADGEGFYDANGLVYAVKL
jgi:hypothetical protein